MLFPENGYCTVTLKGQIDCVSREKPIVVTSNGPDFRFSETKLYKGNGQKNFADRKPYWKY